MASLSMGRERRKHTRYKGAPLGVRLPEVERGLTPWIDDVSTGGILLRAHSAPPVGKALIAELCVPKWPTPLRVEARVVRVVQLERTEEPKNKDLGAQPRVAIALEFQKMRPKDAEKLARLLEENGREIRADPDDRPESTPEIKADLELQLERAHSRVLETELERTKTLLKGALVDLQAARDETRARELELTELRQRLDRGLR
jgi:hypothetical protein